jgi:FKBP-type peptidyl-prolyl cis-trans isomerase 2
MTPKVKKGDTIMLHYSGRFKDGKVFDSSKERNPIPVNVGAGEIIQGLEKAVLDMEPGEKRTVTVKPEDGYGHYSEDLLIEMPEEKIPENISPQEGMQLQLINEGGQKIPVVVKEILDDAIKLDANHPLAGKTLVFDLELVEIVGQ